MDKIKHMKLINPNLVTHINILPLRKSSYKWCDKIPEKYTFFGLIKTQEAVEEGFYENGNNDYYSDFLDGRELINTLTIDNTVYYKPYLSVFAGNKKLYGKHYDSVEEIESVCSEMFPKVSVILKQ